jgi:hypothetical protein
MGWEAFVATRFTRLHVPPVSETVVLVTVVLVGAVVGGVLVSR